MRRKHSKLRMGLRGRSGLLVCSVLGTAVLVVVYYTWSNYFRSSSRISYTSVQGLEPGQLDQWDRERQQEFVIDDPPIGLNKEIEIQMASEKWKRARALQDRIDEDRIAQEQAAQAHGKSIDQILKTKTRHTGDEKTEVPEGEHPLLFMQAEPSDSEYFSKLERVVHLDLKGAPPLVSYLEELFPLLKSMGATGLLMEYEDMFPYSGNLSMLASASAYSLSDLQRIKDAAKLNGLEIIPLVQTFGHMEFVLKHKQFRALREQDYTPQVISPVKQESYALIFSMLEQVLKAHPDSRRIHLGCDEVYELGKGESSSYLTSQKLTPGQLFLQHVVTVARQMKTAFPTVQPLIWDDWLRGITYKEMANSGLATYVEPVVWYYQHDIGNRITPDKWRDYSQLFSGVWVASAFKGATGSSQILTNASLHLDNNLQWVKLMRDYGAGKKIINFRGTVFTGWQRYDHFATLCELLPVGLPSLSLCMQAVKKGGFDNGMREAAGQVLRCSQPLDLEFPALLDDRVAVTQDCRFPGSDVTYAVQQLWGIMEVYRRDVGLQERISGWLTDYHVYRGISSPGQMKVLVRKLNKVLMKLQELMKPMQDSLLKVYDKWTIEEWITINLVDQANHIRDLFNKAKKFLVLKEWPARPFLEMTTKAPGVIKGEPLAVQTVEQSGSKNIPQLNPPQGPQSVSGRVQINGRVPNSNIANKPNAYVVLSNARFEAQGAGMAGKQNTGSANYGGVQEGMLSQMLLKRPGQGDLGRPSGPSKMQSVNYNALRPYPDNRQVVPDQNARGQQQLGQFMPGLPRTQHPLPGGQNSYRVNQNPQGFGAGQYQPQNRQSSGLAQPFQNQQFQNPQRQFVRKSMSDLAQTGLKQPGPLRVQGPEQMEGGPVNPQQAPSVKDGTGKQAQDLHMADTKKGQKPESLVQMPSKSMKFPAVANTELKEGEQKDSVLLDSFVGRRGKDEKELNDGAGGVQEEEADGKNRVNKGEDDYNAEEDNENA